MRIKLLAFLCIAIFLYASCGKPPVPSGGAEPVKKGSITMATTTSTYDSGLLDYLNPKFIEKTGIDVRVVSMGTGAAFRTGEEGNADLLLVHDTEGEVKFVEEGYGTDRRDVMYNDFIILGPADNPAGITKDDPVAEAFAKIAGGGVKFISRGDDSGTHRKEQHVWRSSSVPVEEIEKTIVKNGKELPIRMARPSGEWYLSIGQGMGAALTMANEMRAYVLADRGTYLAYKADMDMVILNEGDDDLKNQYGVIPINPAKHPSAKYDLAMEYVNWITSPDGQALIGDFKVGDEVLFFPNYVKQEG